MNKKPRRNNRTQIMLSDRTAEYFNRCARIRKVHRSSLLRRLLDTIADDMLVGGILDDVDTLPRPLCHDHPTRRCTPDNCCQVVTSQHQQGDEA